MKAEEVTIDVVLNGKKAQKEIGALKSSLIGIKKVGDTTTRVFGLLGKALGLFGAIKITSNAAQLGRSISLLADYTGVAATNLSRMRNAFSSVGVAGKEVDNVLNGITEGLAGLAFGDGAMASKLASMNISAWDENGIRAPDVLMSKIADWAKTQKEMGRRTTDIIYYLKQNFNMSQKMAEKMMLGSAGLQSFLSKQSEKTGVLTNYQIKNLSELSDEYSQLKATLSNSLDSIVADLGPGLKMQAEFLGDISKNVAAFIHKYLGNDKKTPEEWDKINANSIYELYKNGLLSKMEYEEALDKNGFRQEFSKDGKVRIFKGNNLLKRISGSEAREMVGEYEEWDRAQKAYEKETEREERLQKVSELAKKLNMPVEQAKIYDISELQDMVDGVYLEKGYSSFNTSTGVWTIVDVDVENEWVDNQDGTVTVNTTVETTDSGGNEHSQNISKTLNGGHI